MAQGHDGLGSPDRPLPWRSYRVRAIRKAAKRLNLILSLPADHFEAARFRRDLRRAILGEFQERPRRA